MRGLRQRLPSIGLRGRLAVAVTAVVLVCTGITFIAVYRGTGTQLRNQIDHELAGDATDLTHALRLARRRSPIAVAQAAAGYMRGQPFKPSSTLLFAVLDGSAPISNRAELFPPRPADGADTSSDQARENRLSAQLLRAGHGYTTLAAPDLGDLRLLKRTVSLKGGPRVFVGVGEPLAAVSDAQASVARAFVLAAVLALVLALLASYAIGTRMSRPLRRMAAVAARVKAGDLHPRIGDPGDSGSEVRVLAEAFDRMLDRLTEAFASQRAFIADASHELRTPLTVIAGQLEVLGRQAEPSAAAVRRVERQVRSEIAAITRLVDDLLLLARSEHTEFLHRQPIDLPVFVTELWGGVTLIAERRFELGAVPAGVLMADPDRLTQALRNLLTNAIQHTAPESGLVRLRVEPAGAGVRFVIDDDGPGIPVSERERVFGRFNRVGPARDRASGGTGLGLAIVRAIGQAHGGRVRASASPEGGARIELWLGRFASATRADAQGAPGSDLAHDAGVSDRVAAGLGPDA
jgi:two-component system, OmpR family, sensor kinase